MNQQLHLYTSIDDIPEALRRFIVHETSLSVPFFKHPFLVTFLPMGLPCRIDELLEIRAEMAEADLQEGKVSSYIVKVERAFRFDKLLEYADSNLALLESSQEAAEAFWKAARYVWMDGEHSESSPLWRELLETPVPHRQFFTSPESQEKLDQLPARFQVYKGWGCRPGEAVSADEGFSWTLSRKTAEFFAKRWAKQDTQAYIASTSVFKEDVIALILERGESEIIIDPWDIDLEDVLVEQLGDTKDLEVRISP